MIKNSFFENQAGKSGLKSLLFKISIIHIWKDGVTLFSFNKPFSVYSISTHR